MASRTRLAGVGSRHERSHTVHPAARRSDTGLSYSTRRVRHGSAEHHEGGYDMIKWQWLQNRDGVAILVAVKTSAKRPVRVNVTLPEDELERIDQYAKAHGQTRSGFLTQAARQAMKDELADI